MSRMLKNSLRSKIRELTYLKKFKMGENDIISGSKLVLNWYKTSIS